MEVNLDFQINSGISSMLQSYPEELSSIEIEHDQVALITDGPNFGKRRIYIPSKHVNLHILNNLTFRRWRIKENLLSLVYGEKLSIKSNDLLLRG